MTSPVPGSPATAAPAPAGSPPAPAGSPPAPAGSAPAPAAAPPDPRCRACSAPLESGKLFCGRCGTPAPGAPTCPHCGAVADIAPHDEVRVVCKACGAPRIDVDQPGYVLPPAAIDSLRQAERARIQRRRWRIAGAFGGLGAGGILSLALLVQLLLGFSAVGTTLAVLLALPLAIVAALSVARSKVSAAQVETAIDDAWLAAARQLAQQSERPLTGAELGRALHLSEPSTEKLSAQLAVDQLIDTDVTADGQLAFGPGLRFEPPGATAPPPPGVLAPDPRFDRARIGAAAPPSPGVLAPDPGLDRARIGAADTVAVEAAGDAEAANALQQAADLEAAQSAAERKVGPV